MIRKACFAAALASLVGLALTATAWAATLGITTQPSGSSESGCTTGPPSPLIAQATDDPATPYLVPYGGTITQWQTLTTGDSVGAHAEFVVLRPIPGGDYSVITTDSEVIPTPLPSSGVATFTLAGPIAVQAGDTLGLFSLGGVGCTFAGGSTPSGDLVTSLESMHLTPETGDEAAFGLASGPGVAMNLAATFVPSLQDAAVTTNGGPSGASVGQAALLSSIVTNNGSGTAPITFTDHVPSGLTINSALASGGSCSTTAQTVTCTFSGLTAGQSAPVAIVVTPSSPGSYANSVSVGLPAGVTDPNSANNSAGATLSVVGPSQPARCVVPKLKGISAGFAKTVLKDLGCKVKTKKIHSSKVRKGLVISTKPGKGKHPYQTKVTLTVAK